MMYYDHAMLGATMAITAGAHRRHGWPIVLMAAGAAMLPDWDDLSTLFGPAVRREVHRVWGHNLLIAFGAAGLLGAIAYLCRRAARSRNPASAGASGLGAWVAVALLAAASHLLADVVYAKDPNGPGWPVAFFWPFSHRGWALPVLTSEDRVATALLAAGLLAQLRWPACSRLLAGLTLLGVASYAGLHAALDDSLQHRPFFMTHNAGLVKMFLKARLT
jgi:membrane-bound metal-dependent hydrolase YbcI (DUF457 family)